MDETTQLKLKIGIVASMIVGIALLVLYAYTNTMFLTYLGMIFIIASVIMDKAFGFNMFARFANSISSSRRQHIPAYYKAKLWKKQKGKCARCGKALDPHHYHIDHIKPVALGGKTTLSNLQILCPECHMYKTKKDRLKISRYKKSGFDFDLI